MQRYRALNLTRFPMGATQELIYSPLTRQQQLLSSRQIQLLFACRTFETLDQHTSALRQEFAVETELAPNIRHQLQEFVDSGLLVSSDEITRLCLASKSIEDAVPKISCLGIPTHNRPDNLMHCLESFAECIRTHGRDLRIVVADDSNQSEMRGKNLQVLSSIKERYGISCLYAGQKEKEEFARLLAARAEVPVDVVRFAILNDEQCPNSLGANRNTMLLETVGECAVQVDDDVLCRLTPGPEKRQGLTFTSQNDPTEFWFLPENEPPPDWVDVEEIDFFGLHEQLLGKSPGRCIEEHSTGSPVLDAANATFVRRLSSGGARVSVTGVGLCGDSGIGGPMTFLRMDGASRARLVSSPKSYRYAMNSHQILRTANNLTVSDGTFCFGINLGLDNRRCLPPFMPVQRNEDGMFGALVRATAEGYFGFVPWAVTHQRPIRWQQDLHKRAGEINSGEIIQLIIGAFKHIESAGSEKNLFMLGTLLSQIGSARPAHFQELLQQLIWRRARYRITILESLLSKHGRQPEFWAKDLTDYLTELHQAVATKEYAVPSDLREVFGQDAATALMQRLVRRLGQLLQVWPQMRQAAEELRANGSRLGTQI